MNAIRVSPRPHSLPSGPLSHFGPWPSGSQQELQLMIVRPFVRKLFLFFFLHWNLKPLHLCAGSQAEAKAGAGGGRVEGCFRLGMGLETHLTRRTKRRVAGPLPCQKFAQNLWTCRRFLVCVCSCVGSLQALVLINDIPSPRQGIAEARRISLKSSY